MDDSQGHRGIFEAFLQEEAKNRRMLPSARKKLTPFFSAVSENRYAFAQMTSLDKVRIKSALNSVTGADIKDITLASHRHPIPSVTWSVQDTHLSSHREALWDALGTRKGAALEVSLRDNLWKGLEVALATTMGPNIVSLLDYGLWQGIHSTLFYYLGFVLVGDRRRAAA